MRLPLRVRHPRRHGWWMLHVYYQRIFGIQRRPVRRDIWWRVNHWLAVRWLGPLPPPWADWPEFKAQNRTFSDPSAKQDNATVSENRDIR